MFQSVSLMKSFHRLSLLLVAVLFVAACDNANPEDAYLNDNLIPWSLNGKVSNYRYRYYRIGFSLKEGTEAEKERVMTRFIRRDIIDTPLDPKNPEGKKIRVYYSAVVDGNELDKKTTKRPIENLHFDSDNGTGEAIEDLMPFVQNRKWTVQDGVNFLNAQMMARLADGIYHPFKYAAPAFAEMGFNEQYFFSSKITAVANKSDGQGVVLKNDQEIVIAFRGTNPKVIFDLVTDANAFDVSGGSNGTQFHAGFYKAAKDVYPFVREHIPSTFENNLRRSLSGLSTAELRDLGLNINDGETVFPADDRGLRFTGHSLGAAMATATLAELLLPSANLTNIAAEDQKLGQHSSKLNHYVYLCDPILKRQNSAAIEKAVRTLVANNQMEVTELEKRIFEKYGNLAYLPTIEFTDHRIKSLTTFGSPRVGNRAVKSLVEGYAKYAGTALLRFENVWVKQDHELAGDTVTRVPLSDLAKWNYRHVGVRVYYDQQSDGGAYRGPELLKCEYTDETADLLGKLDLRNKSIALTSGEHHMMGLYQARLKKLLDATGGWESGDVGLSLEHSCRDLTRMPLYKI